MTLFDSGDVYGTAISTFPDVRYRAEGKADLRLTNAPCHLPSATGYRDSELDAVTAAQLFTDIYRRVPSA